MKKLLKGLGTGLLALALIGSAVYAYRALTINAEVEVLEAISIESWAGDGAFNPATNVWDIGVIYPTDIASLGITFSNSASGPITLTLTANPPSLDGGNLILGFESTTIEVPAGGTASVGITATTTQSLIPGSYSAEILVQR